MRYSSFSFVLLLLLPFSSLFRRFAGRLALFLLHFIVRVSADRSLPVFASSVRRGRHLWLPPAVRGFGAHGAPRLFYPYNKHTFMNQKEIPVLLLTGYLGSGKTTLLNRILSNEKGIKFAVIVNDLGEVNIDAALIEKGGVVGQKDDSLVALQNGCICCTLKMDLVEQLQEITQQHKFDYIVIEASGICEPAPIAQTICSIPSMGKEYTQHGVLRLDSIVTVVDALRMKSEFANGDKLVSPKIAEEDIENLIIQQIEFCNIILLNKAAEVEPRELARIKQIIRAIQPHAQIIETNYGDVPLDRILDTQLFDFNRVATSAAWIEAIEGYAGDADEEEHDHHGHHDGEHDHHDHDDEHDHHHGHHHDHDDDHDGHDDDHDDHDDAHEAHGHHHGHAHHHHHHHGEGEAEEYGIGTFVYYRRPAFDTLKFDTFVSEMWPSNVIRAKGILYFNDHREMCYVFEQAGVQKTVREAGQWYATMPEEDLVRLMQAEPGILREWDEKYGDRMIKIVFIGQNLDKEAITRQLDACLE